MRSSELSSSRRVKIGYSFDSEVNSDEPLVRYPWFSIYIFNLPSVVSQTKLVPIHDSLLASNNSPMRLQLINHQWSLNLAWAFQPQIDEYEKMPVNFRTIRAEW